MDKKRDDIYKEMINLANSLNRELASLSGTSWNKAASRRLRVAIGTIGKRAPELRKRLREADGEGATPE